MFEKLPDPTLKTWIEIDLKKLSDNFVFAKSISNNSKIMAIVKSNAYGHGLVDFAREVDRLGVDYLGVDSVAEALAIREAGIKTQILILGFTLPSRYSEAFQNDLILTISSEEGLSAMEKTDQIPKFHIKIDTGLFRQGFLFTDDDKNQISRIRELARRLQKFVEKVDGLYTHLAQAKQKNGKDYTLKQIKSFETVKKIFQEEGIKVHSHISASPGLMRYGNQNSEIVRVGALLYGIYPSKSLKDEFSDSIKINPILSWKTIISEMKIVPKGSMIGYDGTYVLERDSLIAVCPIGYWHGYPSSLSSAIGAGYVIVNNQKVRVLGKVTMDMIVIDCTDIKDAKVGEIVTIIDNRSDSEVSAEAVADRVGISVHELLTRLNSRIARKYIMN